VEGGERERERKILSEILGIQCGAVDDSKNCGMLFLV